MARLQPFQRHAITAPVFDKTKLHRARLVQILQDNLWRKLILIVAPAGYGKTTLLADLTAHTDRPVCWVRLTEHDQDAMRLARVIVESVGRRFPRVRKTLEVGQLEGLPPEGVGRALGSLLASAVSRPWGLIIDDLNTARRSPDIGQVLSGLLESQPSTLCTLLLSRAVPDLAYSRAAVDGGILTISQNDLALTEEEVSNLLSDGGSRLSPDEAQTLLAETRGWIAGILLLRLHGLKGVQGTLEGGKELTFEYFAAEVLNQLEDQTKIELLRSSLLPIMTGESVERVVGVEHGSVWLRSVAQRGLFLASVLGPPRTYEYHPLFRDFLRSELKRVVPPPAFRRLTLLAATYLAKSGDEKEAISLYASAGEFKRAIKVADRLRTAKLMSGEVRTLERWVEIADKGGLAAVELRVAHIEARVVYLRALNAKTMIRATLRRLGKQLTRMDVLGLQAWLAWHAVFEGDPKGPARSASIILRKVGLKDMSRAGRLSHAVLANYHLLKESRLDKAEYHARAALRAARSRGSGTSVPFMKNLLVWVLLARGRIDEARVLESRFGFSTRGWRGFADAAETLDEGYWAHLDLQWMEAVRLCESGLAISERLFPKNPTWEGKRILAECLLDIGAIREAMEILGGADRRELSAYPKWRFDHCVICARALRLAGDLNASRSWLEKARSLPDPYRSSHYILLESLAGQIIEGASGLGQRLLSLIRSVRNRRGPVQVEVLARTFLSMCYWRGEMPDEAARAFLGAARLAYETTNLACLCGELAAQAEFAAFLRKRLASEPPLVKLWQAMDSGEETRETLQGSRTGSWLPNEAELKTLGRESIKSNGRSVHLKPLFAEILFFSLDKGPVSRDVLYETFWPGKPLAKQRAAGNAAFYAIRKALGGGAVLSRGEVITPSDRILRRYDVRSFERKARDALWAKDTAGDFSAKAREALSAYGGPFLPGRSREWVVDRRRELESVFRSLVIRYAEECLACGEAGDAVSVVARALGYDPLDEGLAMLAARIDHQTGRWAFAIQALRQFRDRLKKELDLDPSGDFVDLERAFVQEVDVGAFEASPGRVPLSS